MLKKILLAFLVMLVTTTQVFAAEMVVIKALDDSWFSGRQGHQDAKNLLLYFSYLNYQGSFAHNTYGFGLAYHKERDPNTESGQIMNYSGVSNSDRRFAISSVHQMSTFTYPFEPESDSVKVIGRKIGYDTLGTVLMHKRDSSTASQMIVDPQPYVYRDINHSRSYSFMHEGVLTDDQTSLISDFYNQHFNLVDSEITGLIQGNEDSGLLFAYLLLRIKEKDMDILRGLNEAIGDLYDYHSTQGNIEHKFILSDGFDLYILNLASQELRLYKDDSKKITMVTSHGTSNQTADNYIAQVFGNINLTYIPFGGLVYVPFHGDPLFFNFIIFPGEIQLSRRIKNTGFYNWLSFPVLPSYSTLITDHLLPGWVAPTYVVFEDGVFIQSTPNTNPPLWESVPARPLPFADPNLGMKLIFVDSSVFSVELHGEIRPLSPYINLQNPLSQPNTYHNGRWVTYNLASSQSVKDALGGHFGNVYKVVGENWSWDARLISGNVNETKPMEFGKMYEIYFTSTIPYFEWTDVRITRDGFITLNEPATGKLNSQSQYFSFTYQDTYEAIDVMSLSSNQENCLEIGAFAGDICVGATIAEGFPVQVPAYTKGFEGIPLTFKVLLTDGDVLMFSSRAEVYNIETSCYEENFIIAGSIGHTAVRLKIKSDDEESRISARISNHHAYPNPFNPSTTISFNLTNSATVALDVYNIKGQMVKMLLHKPLPSGYHNIQWNGSDDNNRPVSSGIYFYRIKIDNHQTIGKMLLMK